MVRTKIKYILSFVLFFSLNYGQNSTFVKTIITPGSVYVKEPATLRIGLYTKTWFTKSPNLDNIVIPGAITVRKDRAQSTFEVINGTRYTILNFDFFVFPLKSGELEIPVIELIYSTPLEGDYKGKEYTKTTKLIKLNVKESFDNISDDQWIPARSYSVSEEWSKNLSKLKVGDVVEHTLRISTTGTISALIPESKKIDIPFGKLYSKSPRLTFENDRGELSAIRIERNSVLIEKPGEYKIPKQEFLCWNYSSGKMIKRVIETKKIVVEDNPDLAILKTVQDSLIAVQNLSIETDEETKSYLDYISSVVYGIALILILYKFIVFIYTGLNKDRERKKELYLNSEKYLFDQMKTYADKKDYLKFYQTFYQTFHEWFLKIHPAKGTSIGRILTNYNNKVLLEEFIKLENGLFSDGKDIIDLNLFLNKSKMFSLQVKESNRKSTDRFRLNPTII